MRSAWCPFCAALTYTEETPRGIEECQWCGGKLGVSATFMGVAK